jgi:hypothetical protein
LRAWQQRECDVAPRASDARSATRVAGGLLLFVGILMLTDYMKILTQWLLGLTPDFLRSRL